MRTGTNRISNNDYVFDEQNVEEMAVEGDIFLVDLLVHKTICGKKFRFFAFCSSQLHLTALV